MTAILLNSGKGSRLHNLTKDNPKCLVELDQDVTILSRQLDLLSACGVTEYIITTGYLASSIEEYIASRFPDLSVQFVYNEVFDTTNYIVSLDKLSEIPFTDDVLLMHGDLVFSKPVLTSVIASEGSTVVVDSTLALPEKDFKARIDKGLVAVIGIHEFGPDCFACQPLYKLTKSDWSLWQEAIHSFCEAGKTNVYAEDALNTITDTVHINPLDVRGKLCMEVDNQEDLMRAKNLLKKEI